MPERCTAEVEVWDRVCGFFRPVTQFNKGKKAERKARLNYKVEGADADSDR